MNQLIHADDVASDFLTAAAHIRSVVAQALATDPYAADIAMLQGRYALAERMTPEFKAFIKYACDKGDIETSQNPSPDRIFDAVARAFSLGMSIGRDEFGIWGGKAGNPLYIKANGFRRLLTQTPGVSEVRVLPGVPEWARLQDKHMWVCTGEASCKVNGNLMRVICDDSHKFGVNGNATDGIASVTAKAERALLRKLWAVVSTINVDDESLDGEQATVSVVEPVAITQHPASGDWIAREKAGIKSPRALDAWVALEKADTAARVDAIMKGVRQIEATGADKASLERFAEHRLQEIG